MIKISNLYVEQYFPALSQLLIMILQHASSMDLLKNILTWGNSPVVQGLRLPTFIAEGRGSVSGRETNIPRAVRCSQKKKKINLEQSAAEMAFIFYSYLVNYIEFPTHIVLCQTTVKFLIVLFPFIAAFTK